MTNIWIVGYSAGLARLRSDTSGFLSVGFSHSNVEEGREWYEHLDQIALRYATFEQGPGNTDLWDSQLVKRVRHNLVDSVLAFAYAVSKLIDTKQEVTSANIATTLRTLEFTGIAGRRKFSANQDSINNYQLENLVPVTDDSSGGFKQDIQIVGRFAVVDESTNTMKLEPSMPIT